MAERNKALDARFSFRNTYLDCSRSRERNGQQVQDNAIFTKSDSKEEMSERGEMTLESTI